MTALEALNLAAPLADTYEAVERRLLVAIARQLSLNDNHTLNEVSKWQIKQLAKHGMLGKDAAQIIAAGTKGIPENVAAAVEQAIEAALAEDGLSEMRQNESFAESAKQAVKHYRNQAKDVYNQVNTVMKYKAESTFVNAVNSVADKWSADLRRKQAEIADKQSFLDILNSNTAAVVSGSTARTKAVRDTIHEMAQKGIPAFVDRAGREWSPEAYVNMDIRNTVKNTALEAKFSVMDSLGQDVFEVSSHPGSRPKCRLWQGKLISRSGRTTEITDLHGRKHKVIPLSKTSYGEPDGLFGINCGHRPRGCTEGVFTKSEVEYDDEEDKELYNKVCRQRELERRVRKSKTEADMLEAAGDTEGAKEVRRKMAEQNKALRQYCEDNGLKYRSDRVRTYGAAAPKKALDKSAGSDIIRIDETDDVSVYLKQRKRLELEEQRLKKLEAEADDAFFKYDATLDEDDPVKQAEFEKIFRSKEKEVESQNALIEKLKQTLSPLEEKAVNLLEVRISADSGIPRSEVMLKGMAFDMAKEISDSVKKTVKRYPELKGHLSSLKIGPTSENAYAACNALRGKLICGEKMRNAVKMRELYLEDVALGFHPVGTDSRAIIVHEMGHALDGYMTSKGMLGGKIISPGNVVRSSKQVEEYVLGKLGWQDKVKALRADLLKRGITGGRYKEEFDTAKKAFIKSEISEYAADNERELFAELFAEYVMSPHPRKAAQIFGEYIDKTLGR